jgi:hypothetical protein
MGGATIAGVVALAFGTALVCIRDRRMARYSLLAAALIGAAGFERVIRTGTADVDVVEAFHFVEYGAFAALVCLACRDRPDASMLVIPIMGAIIVGAADEWVQWFVPSRVGELRDVGLDTVAAVCGVMVIIAIAPPRGRGGGLLAGSRERIGWWATAAIVTLAAFVQSVHLGFLVTSVEGGDFRSRYSGAELRTLGQERLERWRVNPPMLAGRWSREDQYLSEAVWHVQARNLAAVRDDPATAWHENAILEDFFASALDTRSYISAAGFRWPPDQRERLSVRGRGTGRFVSRAAPYPIFVWARAEYWIVVAAAVAGIVAGCRERKGRRFQRGDRRKNDVRLRVKMVP